MTWLQRESGHHRHARRTLGALAILLTAACGGDTVDTPDGDTGGGGEGGGVSDYPGPPGDWVDLVDAGWELSSGSEGYHCARKTIEEDMWVGAFRALAPEGTHHTVVTLSDSTEPDGEFACGAGTLADEMIFTSGVGTDDLILPEGVAFKIPAGRKILLNLHLYNVTGDTLEGLSGTQVKVLEEADVEQEAEVVFAGTVLIAVPPMSEASTTGTCTFQQDATVMSIWPHMHQYGTHMDVTHEGEDNTVLHDEAFDFEEQINYRIPPRQVKAGEKLRVNCSYENPTADTLTFGDSSDQEMCFAGIYRYPAEKSGTFCDMPFF